MSQLAVMSFRTITHLDPRQLRVICNLGFYSGTPSRHNLSYIHSFARGHVIALSTPPPSFDAHVHV